MTKNITNGLKCFKQAPFLSWRFQIAAVKSRQIQNNQFCLLLRERFVLQFALTSALPKISWLRLEVECLKSLVTRSGD